MVGHIWARWVCKHLTVSWFFIGECGLHGETMRSLPGLIVLHFRTLSLVPCFEGLLRFRPQHNPRVEVCLRRTAGGSGLYSQGGRFWRLGDKQADASAMEMMGILVGRVTQFQLSIEPHQQISISYHFYAFLYSSRSWIHIFYDTSMVWLHLIPIFPGGTDQRWCHSPCLAYIVGGTDFGGGKKQSDCWVYLYVPCKIKVEIRFVLSGTWWSIFNPSGQAQFLMYI